MSNPIGLAGTHRNSRGRTFLRRLVIFLAVIWCIYTIDHWVHNNIVGHEDRCFRHLIPWNGPTAIVADAADSIDVIFDKGDMTSSIEVVTSDNVYKPTLLIDAWVTKNYPHDPHDEMAVKGLEVHVTTEDGWVKVILSSEDNTGRRGWPHKKKFCAKVHVKIVFPSTLRIYGRLSVTGIVATIDVRDVSQIAFEGVRLRTTVGDVNLHDPEAKGGLQTKSLDIYSVTGAIQIASTQSTPGNGLRLNLEANVGSLRLNATTNPIKTLSGMASEELRHNLILKTNTGAIDANVHPGAGYHFMSSKESVVGDVYIDGETNVGHIGTTIVLASKQVLHQELVGNTGSVKSTISDNYLGTIDVRTDFGHAQVHEAIGSPSRIEYEVHTKTVLVGRKILKEEGGGEAKGAMNLHSRFGGVGVTFMPLQ
ncbi:hypothetical protein FBU30_008919 [Linnemannia zychae]|nr:hypothetical protein FBU30_008919 [Linnemannia zychae]